MIPDDTKRKKFIFLFFQVPVLHFQLTIKHFNVKPKKYFDKMKKGSVWMLQSISIPGSEKEFFNIL